MDAPLDLVIARWVFFALAMFLFGSALFPVYAFGKFKGAGPAAGRRLTAIVGSFALLAAIFWLFALSHELDATQPILTTIQTVLFETSFGPSWIARLILAALAAAAAWIGWPVAVLVASAGMLICEGWDGHAAAHGLFGELTQALHVVCAGVWIGGLFPFAALVSRALRIGAEWEVLAPVRRFSAVATGAVIIILLTGIINVILLEPGLVLTGVYARTLGIKLALVAAMILFAAFNRFRLLPRIQTESARGTLAILLRTTVCEQVLGVTVLLAVAVLGLLDPYMANM